MTINIPILPREPANVPTEEGVYIAFFLPQPQLIYIIMRDGELFNVNGASTHFTRWSVRWSEKLEFV